MTDIAMGFDFGQTKIGVAVGQSVTGTATPLGIVKARDGKPDWNAVDGYVTEWKPSVMVVGLPLNMDDTMSEMGEAAAKFGRRLNGRYNLPVEMVDERLSTFEARGMTDEDQVDAVAAKLILETYLQTV